MVCNGTFEIPISMPEEERGRDETIARVGFTDY